jgi:hypothetical protein
LLPEKYIEVAKKLLSKSYPGSEVVDLPGCHVAASLTAAPFIFTAGRTVILPSEGPELGGYSAHTCPGLVAGFLTASEVAAAASVRIWRLGYPSEFGAGLFDGQPPGKHEFKIHSKRSY